MHALILASLIGFAPAPVFKDRPLTPKEQEVLLKEAESEMHMARVLEGVRVDCGFEPSLDDGKHTRALYRSAAEKLERLHAELRPGEGRTSAALLAGEAWLRAGEAEKSLRRYEGIAGRAEGKPRLRALVGMRDCLLALNRPREAIKAAGRVCEEADRLGGDIWNEPWMKAVEVKPSPKGLIPLLKKP